MSIIVQDFMSIIILLLAPSAPPTEIKLVDEMCDSITVTWEPPPMENWNGPSVSYIISWKVAGGIPLGSVSVQSSDRSYTIPYLRPYRDYSVRMASENSAGIGIYSNEQTTKTAPCRKFSLLIKHSTRPMIIGVGHQ